MYPRECDSRDDREVRAEGDRAALAARLGGRGRVPHAESRARRDREREDLRRRDAAVPVGRAAHGARPQLHDRRRRRPPAPPARLSRAAADGLRRVRPARRERRDPRGRAPAHLHRAQHRLDPRADAPHGLGDGLGARGLDARSRRTTAGRNGSSSASTSAGSPIARRGWSTGARSTRRCSRTSR